VHVGPIIKPQGVFQYCLYWAMPALQPVLTLLLAALSIFPVAFASVAALHFEPYIAPLLLLPLLWLGLVFVTLALCVALKWLLLNRVQPKAYAKYSWAFQTKVVNTAINVRPPPSLCI
jgi:hypothetical protein